MDSMLQTRAQLSADNHGPFVVVTSYILMSVMILSTIARLRPNRHTFSEIPRPHRQKFFEIPRPEECLILLAMTIAIVEDVLIEKDVDYGLGGPQSDLNANNLVNFDKMTYISQLLYVAVLCLTKLSIILSIRYIALARWAAISCQVLFYAVGLWGISAILALAFQCKLPSPWETSTGRCIDQIALNYFIGVFNICTDFLVFVIPTVIVMNVQTTTRNLSIVIAAFASRPIGSAANIVQLYTLSRDFDPLNRTQSAYVPTLWMQIVLNLSVITACIPFLHPLLTNLHSGLMDATVRSESLTPSAVDIWNNHMQLSSHWKTPRTKRAGMEEYSGRGGSTPREGTEVIELTEGV